MKTKEAKYQTNEEVMIRTELVLDEWWAVRTTNERMLLYALVQFMDRLTEKKEMHVRMNGKMVSVGVVGTNSAGVLGAEVVSFPKPDFFKDSGDQTVNDLWLELSAHEQKL